MNEYENDTTNDPLKQAKDDIGQVKDIMVKNVEQVLSRGERIDLLVDRTNDMSSQAFAFRKRSTVLRVSATSFITFININVINEATNVV